MSFSVNSLAALCRFISSCHYYCYPQYAYLFLSFKEFDLSSCCKKENIEIYIQKNKKYDLCSFSINLKGIWTLNANAMRRTDSSVQSGPPWQRLIDFVEVGHFTGVFTHCALYIWLQTQMRWTQSILMSSARPTPESLVISSPLLLSFHLCPINESWLDLEKDKRDSCEQFNRAQWPPGLIWPFRNKSKTEKMFDLLL